MPIILKYFITALVVVAASEIAKRSDKLGALIVALPMVTIIAMIWIYAESKSGDQATKLASHAYYTFWYVIPTLPMFLVMSKMLKSGVNFWIVLLTYMVGTWILFALTVVILKRFGIELL